MPLDYSKSKGAFQRNVEAERAAGKPIKQSVAIAYAVKRRSKAQSLGEQIRKHLTPSGKLRRGD